MQDLTVNNCTPHHGPPVNRPRRLVGLKRPIMRAHCQQAVFDKANDGIVGAADTRGIRRNGIQHRLDIGR